MIKIAWIAADVLSAHILGLKIRKNIERKKFKNLLVEIANLPHKLCDKN